jgi:hypothetical protein
MFCLDFELQASIRCWPYTCRVRSVKMHTPFVSGASYVIVGSPVPQDQEGSQRKIAILDPDSQPSRSR